MKFEYVPTGQGRQYKLSAQKGMFDFQIKFRSSIENLLKHCILNRVYLPEELENVPAAQDEQIDAPVQKLPRSFAMELIGEIIFGWKEYNLIKISKLSALNWSHLNSLNRARDCIWYI